VKSSSTLQLIASAALHSQQFPSGSTPSPWCSLLFTNADANFASRTCFSVSTRRLTPFSIGQPHLVFLIGTLTCFA
jgi:hypothetical protein